MTNWKESLTKAVAYRPLQIVLLIAGVLLAVYFIGKKAGKGATVSYPGSKTADPVTDDFATKQAPNILDALFQAFDGYSLDVDEKTLAIEKILFLTDNQLVYIFNRYNQRYLAGTNDTLYSVINSEYFGPIGLAAQRKREILQRMRGLGMDKPN